MNASTSVEQTKGTSDAISGIGWKVVLRFAIFVLLLPAVLFIAAGRLNWVMGWVYVGLAIASTAASRIIVMFKNPELIAERAQYREGEGVKDWDRVLVALVALYGPLATLIVAGLDERFGWPPQLPLALQLVALAVVVLGYFMATWAMVVNKFFSAVVRIQKDRDHAVVTSGPYRFVRHPAYAGGIISYLATPVMLDALWALIPAGLIVVGVIVRTALEDRTLREELAGYAEYAQQTRYRLLPGIW
jgi:protein-S-isoprenylcysteine O-methyltransferase Ste14